MKSYAEEVQEWLDEVKEGEVAVLGFRTPTPPHDQQKDVTAINVLVDHGLRSPANL